MSYSTLLSLSFIIISIIIDTSIAQKNGEVENEISNHGAAPAPNDCSECWCQCKRLSFRDKYGRIHGNCQRYIFFFLYVSKVKNSFLLVFKIE